MKNILEKIGFFVAASILIVAVIEPMCFLINTTFEISHRHIDPGVGGKDVYEYRGQYIRDSKLFWRLDPSLPEHNSFGFRGEEFAYNKPEGVFRIICMGDSITYGPELKSSETYPALLKERLTQQYPGRRFEVINAGVAGYTSFQGLTWIKEEILSYSPDLLILYYGINDKGCSTNGLPDNDQKMPPQWIISITNYLQRFQSYQTARKLILYLQSFPFEGFSCESKRVSPGEYYHNLLEIEEIAGNNGCKTIFIVQPALYDAIGKKLVTLETYIPPQGIYQFSIYQAFKGYPGPIDMLFLADTYPEQYHLTAGGHDFFTNKLVEWFMKSQFLAGK